MAEFASASIVPTNAGPFRRAQSATSAEFRPIDVSLITKVWNPDTCPLELLPHLAASLSVDIWDEDWPEVKKRHIIKRSIFLHRRKRLLPTIREYASWRGAEILRFIRPPAKSYYGASQTFEEREAWLERLPQIKLYQTREAGSAQGRSYYGVLRNFAETAFCPGTTAGDRLEHKAALIDGETETPIKRLRYENGGTGVYVPGQGRGRSFYGVLTARCFVPKSEAKHRIYSFNIGSPFASILHRFALSPSLRPVLAEPRKIYERGHAGRSVYCGQYFGGRFFSPSRAADRIYDQIPLFDATRQPARRKAAAFFGYSRLGSAYRTAELTVSIPSKRNILATDRFVGGFFVATSDLKLRETANAIQSAADLDTILINTTTYRPVRAGMRLHAGSPLLAGELRRSL